MHVVATERCGNMNHMITYNQLLKCNMQCTQFFVYIMLLLYFVSVSAH